MNIQLFSMYDNFTLDKKPTYINWVKESCGLECYVDFNIYWTVESTNKKIAILIEPRSLQPDVYTFMEQHYSQFNYVFTHDSKLLATLPNAKYIVFGGIWDSSEVKKTKLIQMISSNKTMCELHIKRMELAKKLESKVDCFGTYKGDFKSTYDTHAEYKYAVVIENEINDYWFTEKICNCFANKVIPIYYGARKISQFFNDSGMIECKEFSDLEKWVGWVLLNGDSFYEITKPAVEYNYNEVKKYAIFEDWFYTQYKELLESLVK